MQQLENKLDELLNKKAPYQLPENVKKSIAKIMPWLALAGGIIGLFGAWTAYQAVTITTTWGNYVDSWNRAYGYPTDPVSNLSFLLWVSLAILVVQSILFFAAFPALKAVKKSGWSILFWVSLVNVAYAVVAVLYSQNIGTLIISLLESLIGLYILFQIRGQYTATGAKPSVPGSTSSDKTASTGGGDGSSTAAKS